MIHYLPFYEFTNALLIAVTIYYHIMSQMID